MLDRAGWKGLVRPGWTLLPLLQWRVSPRWPQCGTGGAIGSAQQVETLKTLSGAAVRHEAHGCPPLVQPAHGRLSQGKELGVDDGEHGLATPVTVPQGTVQQFQEASG